TLPCVACSGAHLDAASSSYNRRYRQDPAWLQEARVDDGVLVRQEPPQRWIVPQSAGDGAERISGFHRVRLGRKRARFFLNLRLLCRLNILFKTDAQLGTHRLAIREKEHKLLLHAFQHKRQTAISETLLSPPRQFTARRALAIACINVSH